MITTARLAVLEYLALWEGALSAQRLGTLLGLSREHAQRTLIGPYRQGRPDSLVANGKRPSWIDPDHTPTRWIPSDPGGFVAVLTGLKAISRDTWPVGGAFESVPLISRANGDNTAFVAIHRAMCQRRSIDVEYRAKRGPRSWRFSPHALVDTGNRPHFRGYAADPVSEDGHFIDLVPARVASVGSMNAEYISPASDDEWTNRVDLTFRIRNDMDKTLSEAITTEYDLFHGEIIITDVRKALVRYVIRYYLERRTEGRELPIFEHIR